MASTKTVPSLAKSANRLDRVKGSVKLYPYRILAGLVVVAALLLTMATPQDLLRLQMPEPWSYQLAAENFVQGKWTLTTEEVAAARTQVRIQGSRLTQYIEIAPDVWAFRQSPGMPLQLAFFQTVTRQPRLANISLALAASLIVYTLLSLWFNEKAALIGVTLLLSTPISLLALHYTLMDTFSGGMWPLIAGGALLIFEKVERDAMPVWLWAILFLAGFAAGWSAVVRITSLPLPLLSGV